MSRVQLTDQIAVETDIFEHREVKSHFINRCCFGEDFAAWLKQELLRDAGLGFEFSEPIQEDYGWGLWASRARDRSWIALSYVGDGPQDAPAPWTISVSNDSGLNPVKRAFHKPDREAFQQLRDRVWRAVTSNISIKIVPAPRLST